MPFVCNGPADDDICEAGYNGVFDDVSKDEHHVHENEHNVHKDQYCVHDGDNSSNDYCILHLHHHHDRKHDNTSSSEQQMHADLRW
ncbi:unnamed protein product [Zymoseptoria tritici ST99CH_3D7]|uniref:Uncharacterized protein n=1 Tax=Zymoseptoria tritici (strain ST99CH_3D7) TaxID=1276538 RepID=A0A1X7RWM8_ZYMT9|nr:unnamed protein product [Zymoseptoria tritici ST99CH_3D7]